MKRDVALLFVTRFLRLFAYGVIAIVLAKYLLLLELPGWQVGSLFTLTLWGDTVISLFITSIADRVGRKRMLILGSVLMVFAAAMFSVTQNFWLLLFAATIGVISPNGKEVGPFLAIEQAALSDVVGDAKRTMVFGWYNVVGSFAGAIGALGVAGFTYVTQYQGGLTQVQSYQGLIAVYGVCGLLLGVCFLFLTKDAEVHNPTTKARVGLHKSRKTVYKLSGLFCIDAFAGGFIMQTLIAFWFSSKGLTDPQVGALFFGAEVLAGISALVAVKMAKRFGLINTMVFTHLPSNILLILVPFMPSAWLAALVYMLRCSISQMDVPTRQSYTMAVVEPDERSAAGGFTNIARTVGASLAAPISSTLQVTPGLSWAPLVISGSLKAVYDLLLYASFKRLPAPEEMEKK